MRDPPKTRASRLRRRARSGHGDAEVLDFKADAAIPDLEAREHVGEVPARVEALRPARAIAPGLLPFIPYQMLNCLPPIMADPFGIAAPIGWFMGESLNHTIRKPPLGVDADGSPPEPVLNQTS